MRVPLIIFVCLCSAATAPVLHAQAGETSMFGSLQVVFFQQESRALLGGPVTMGSNEITEARSSFAVQQLDLFLQKPIDECFNAFIDIEYKLNYASDHRWGSLSLQEAWLNFAPSDLFNVKAGLLYPAFNNLNEIKNRLALLPYVLRPGVYERLLSSVYMSEDYLPERAYLQFHGAIPHGDVFWDYALYVGNSEGAYISRIGEDGQPENDLNSSFEFLTGVDPTEFNMKLFGGRIGLRARDEQFKAGLSITHDYDNFRDTTRMPSIYNGPRTPLAGDAARVRLGVDVSGKIGPVHFESEVIKVLYDYQPAVEMDVELDHLFYYSMLGYAVDDRLFLYGSYEGGTDTFDSEAVHYTVGGGAAYSFSDVITAKAQYMVFHQRIQHLGHEDKMTLRFLFLGFSIVL